MNHTLYIGMAIFVMSLIGLVGLVCLVGLLIGAASDSRGVTWAAFKERLPSFLGLVAFLATLGLLEYGTILIIQHYGA
jgi:hypothetical protein